MPSDPNPEQRLPPGTTPGSAPAADAAIAASRLHPFSWLFVLLTSLRSVGLPLVLLIVFGSGETWELWGALGAVVLALYSLVYSFSFRYRLDADEILIKEGLFNRTERHVPYARIQNIVQKRNPLHRAFGVTELRLESAGGSKPEAVMNVITLAEATRIERILRGHAAPAGALAEAHPEHGETLLELPTRDVLLLGLLTSRGWVVIGAAMGAGWQFEWWEKDSLRDWFRLPSGMFRSLPDAPADALGWMITIPLALALFVIVLKLFSLLVALTSFHGFRLHRDGQRVATEAGLITRHAASARVDKIQRLVAGESWLARRFGRRWLSCVVAAGGAQTHDAEEERRRLKWLAPIAQPDKVREIAVGIDPALDLDALAWQPLHPRAWRREFRPPALLFSAIALASSVWLGPIVLPLWAAIVAWLWLNARGWARFAAYACDGRVLAFRAGWLTRQWTIARIAKGQSLTVAISPFDRRHRMAGVQLDVAGSAYGAFDLSIPYLDEAHARALAGRVHAAME